MRALAVTTVLAVACACQCGKGLEDLDGGGAATGGGSGGGSGGSAGGFVAADNVIAARGNYTSIALDLQERPQILTRFTGPILATWTGTQWAIEHVFDAGNALCDDPTLSIDSRGVRHMSWERSVGNIEYAVLTDAGLERFQVFRQASNWFGAVPSSPRDRSGAPIVAYVQLGNGYGVHFARQLPDAGFTDVQVSGLARNVSLARRSDGGAIIAWQRLGGSTLELGEELADGGFSIEQISQCGEGTISLALGHDDQPQLVFQRIEGFSWATRDGGSWAIETIDALPSGQHASLALAPDGTPRVAFQGRDGVLLFARRSASGWSVRQIGTELLWPSIAVDSRGASHVSYIDLRDGGTLRYLGVPP